MCKAVYPKYAKYLEGHKVNPPLKGKKQPFWMEGGKKNKRSII